MQFAEVAAGRIKQPGCPRAGTPDLHTSNFAINNYIDIDSPLEKRNPLLPIAANGYVDYKRTYSLKRICCDATSAACYPDHMLRNRLTSFGILHGSTRGCFLAFHAAALFSDIRIRNFDFITVKRLSLL